MTSVISPTAAFVKLPRQVSPTSPDARAETATQSELLASRERLAVQCECYSRAASALLADRFRAAAAADAQ